MRVWRKCRSGILLFILGGLAYNIIEILWRGYTHWTMFYVGGACFHLIGRVQTRCRHVKLLWRCSLCSVGITTIEFLSGCLVNLRWKMNVWDYSALPVNVLGQVCLLYSVLWGMLSIIAMPLYDRCRCALKNHGI